MSDQTPPTPSAPACPQSQHGRCPTCGRIRLEPGYGECQYGVGTYKECMKCDAICDFVPGDLFAIQAELAEALALLREARPWTDDELAARIDALLARHPAPEAVP